jgi:hypothetical protein
MLGVVDREVNWSPISNQGKWITRLPVRQRKVPAFEQDRQVSVVEAVGRFGQRSNHGVDPFHRMAGALDLATKAPMD